MLHLKIASSHINCIFLSLPFTRTHKHTHRHTRRYFLTLHVANAGWRLSWEHIFDSFFGSLAAKTQKLTQEAEEVQDETAAGLRDGPARIISSRKWGTAECVETATGWFTCITVLDCWHTVTVFWDKTTQISFSSSMHITHDTLGLGFFSTETDAPVMSVQ